MTPLTGICVYGSVSIRISVLYPPVRVTGMLFLKIKIKGHGYLPSHVNLSRRRATATSDKNIKQVLTMKICIILRINIR